MSNPFTEAAERHHRSRRIGGASVTTKSASAPSTAQPTIRGIASPVSASRGIASPSGDVGGQAAQNQGPQYPFPPTHEQQYIIDTFSRGENMVIMAGAGTGKALRDDQNVMTPKGPRPIGSLWPGEFVIGTTGEPVRVTAVYPQGVRPLYRVTTCDGVSVVADDDHLWRVRVAVTKNVHLDDVMTTHEEWRTVTTSAIHELLAEQAFVHLPTLTAPARFDKEPETRVFTGFPKASPPRVIHAASAAVAVTTEDLEGIKWGTISQRYGFLREFLSLGIDGFVPVDGNDRAELVAHVARSLGGIAEVRSDQSVSDGYVVRVRLPERTSEGIVRPSRRIVSVVPVASDNATCISDDSPDKLYATEGFVLTHNTSTLSLLGETMYAADPHARGFYVVFNRSMADEVASRFPRGNVSCSTIHSLANRACRKNSVIAPLLDRLSDDKPLKPKDLPSYLVVDALELETTPKNELLPDGSNSKTLTISARRMCTEALKAIDAWCASPDQAIAPDHVEKMEELPEELHTAEYVAAVMKLAKRMWDEDITNAKGRMRFQHSYYLKMWALTDVDIATEFGLDGRKVVFFFDEAQDAAPVVSDIVLRQKDKLQLVLVGDSSQAIYQWMGAIDALAKFREWDNVALTKLTKTWRFGPAIAAVANAILDTIGGDVRIVPNTAVNSVVRTVSRDNERNSLPESLVTDVDAVITRSNAEIIPLLLGYTDMGYKVFCNADNARITMLCDELERLKDGKKPWTEEMKVFHSYAELMEVIESNLSTKGDTIRIDSTRECNRVLLSLLRSIIQVGPAKVRSLLSRTARTEEEADIVLSTIHKSKGREWPRVWVASAPWRMFYGKPSEYARDEEWMLVYVAVTRSVDVLYLDSELLAAINPKHRQYTPGADPVVLRLGPMFPTFEGDLLVQLAATTDVMQLGDTELVNLALCVNMVSRTMYKLTRSHVSAIELISSVGTEPLINSADFVGVMPVHWVLTSLAGAIDEHVHPKLVNVFRRAIGAAETMTVG
jgi:superfamily I DNA/RNA helicase